MKAYIYTETEEDQRMPHESGIFKTVEDLKELGLHYWRLEGDNITEQIDAIAAERSYKNRDEITVSAAAMGAIYEEKVKSFFKEHLHEDEEIRFILDGSGYFDVRDKNDTWIRIQLDKGDLLVLPSGIYHRFTTDESDYIKAMRLFKEDPKWTPINRPEADDNKFREQYLNTLSSAA
ncbi:hypothetical protein BDF14DRAFT_1757449 [Spinellus fusiger]|nr:hypothetical protein BDF14DRAFT_1757449 [Spinellus fusiger]